MTTLEDYQILAPCFDGKFYPRNCQRTKPAKQLLRALLGRAPVKQDWIAYDVIDYRNLYYCSNNKITPMHEEQIERVSATVEKLKLEMEFLELLEYADYVQREQERRFLSIRKINKNKLLLTLDTGATFTFSDCYEMKQFIANSQTRTLVNR